MLELKPQQRAEFSETLRDLANLTFGALALGQVIGDQPISLARSGGRIRTNPPPSPPSSMCTPQ
jgi:hypothetical protein